MNIYSDVVVFGAGRLVRNSTATISRNVLPKIVITRKGLLGLIIRKATEQDVEDIYKLICILGNANFSFEQFAGIYLLNMGKNNIGYFVAQIDKLIVGFGSVYINHLLHHCGKVAEIQELIICENFRRKNIGSRLVHEIINWSKIHNALQVEVTCNSDRVDAHRFYTKIGFLNTHKKFVCVYK